MADAGVPISAIPQTKETKTKGKKSLDDMFGAHEQDPGSGYRRERVT